MVMWSRIHKTDLTDVSLKQMYFVRQNVNTEEYLCVCVGWGVKEVGRGQKARQTDRQTEMKMEIQPFRSRSVACWSNNKITQR